MTKICVTIWFCNGAKEWDFVDLEKCEKMRLLSASWDGHSEIRMYIDIHMCLFYFSVRGNFLLFTLSGWSKRALIARGSQRVFLEGDCCVLSLAIGGVGAA